MTRPEQASTCLSVLPNLEGWYDFDGLASPTPSVGGLGPDAAWFGAPVTIPGLAGSALRFNGSSFLEVANSTAFNYPTQNFTVSLWIRTTAAGAVFVDKRCLGTAGGCATPQGWAVAVSPLGHLQLLMGAALPYFYEGFSAFNLKKINDGQWHFVTVIVDRTFSRVTFAVDPAAESDVQVVSIDGYSGAIPSVRPMRIGGDQTSPAKFVGDLDEVQLYARALLPFETVNLFSAGPGGQCRPPVCSPVSARRSMVGWYAFEEMAGTIWNDRAAQNNFLGGSAEQVVGQIGFATQFVRIAPAGGLRTFDGASELDPGPGDFALASWVRFFPGPGGRRAILDKHGDLNSTNGGYALFLDDGFVALQLTPTGQPRAAGAVFAANRTRVDDGRWHHVAAVVDRASSSVSLYVDGQLETLARRPAVPSGSFSSGAPLNIGGFSSEASETIASLDEIAIFNSTLTAAEVRSMFEAAGTGYCRRDDRGCVSTPSGLLSWYRFENSTGPFDDSGTAPNEPMVAVGGIARASGRVGRGVRLAEGASSLRTLGATPKLNFDLNAFSFGFWIQPGPSPRSASAGSRTILEKMTYTSPPNAVRATQGYRVRLVNGRLELALASGGNLGIFTGSTALRANQWAMVSVVVPRDAEPRLFVNGVAEPLAAAGTLPTGSLATAAPLVIGSSADASLNPLDPIAFDFDELSFYGRLLTPAEVQALALANAGQCFTGQVAAVKPVFEIGTSPPNIGATVGVSGDSSALDNYATTIAPSAVTVAPTVLTAPGGLSEFRFRDWSLDGVPNPEWTSTVQSVPLPANAATYTANFDTFHRLAVNVTGNCRVSPLTGFYRAGTALPLDIVLPTGWVVNTATFTPLNAAGQSVSQGRSLLIASPSTLEVVCRNATLFPITVAASPANVGLSVIADGNPVSNSQNFSWPSIPARILNVFPQVQVVGLTQYTFRRWRNGATNATIVAAPLSQLVVLPASPTSFIADFEPTGFQVLVRQPIGCAISVSPSPGAGGFYPAGTPLSIAVTPSSGYVAGLLSLQPLSASGAVARPSPANINLDGPLTVSATCEAQATAVRFLSSPAPADLGLTFVSAINGIVARAQGSGSVMLTLAPGNLTLTAAPTTTGGTDGAIRRFIDITPGNLPSGSTIPAPTVSTTYTANYDVHCYYLGVGLQPANAGSFSVTLLSGEKPYLNAECYTPGSLLRVEAFPRPGFSFLQWIGDAPNGGSTTLFVVTKATSLTAVFRAANSPSSAPSPDPRE